MAFWQTLPMPGERRQQLVTHDAAPDRQPGANEPQPVDASDNNQRAAPKTREIGGPKGPEPTRYGDWERSGRCIDF